MPSELAGDPEHVDSAPCTNGQYTSRAAASAGHGRESEDKHSQRCPVRKTGNTDP